MMTQSNATPLACEHCAAPTVTYTMRGRTYHRRLCATHWAAYMAALKHQQQPVLDGWQYVRAARLRPPEGCSRLRVSAGTGYATVYVGDHRRAVRFRTLRRLNTTGKVIAVYQALGWTLISRTHNNAVLEKSA